MRREQIVEARQALGSQLPATGELLRGSLFERTVRHTSGCTICAGGGGHPLWVLTISYAGGRTRQFSLRREQVDDVRRWLGNYHKLKEALEDICERWAARRTWWRRMLASTRPRTRRPRKPRASSASASPTAPPRALSANASKRSVGSATARNGGPAARVASAWSNDGMDWVAAGTRGIPESSAGSASG